MPSFVPHVTMDPRCRLPSTWKDGHMGFLTDKAIEDYERLGWYGPDAQKRRKLLDGAKVVNGITRLPKPCVACNKRLGHWMVFSYLPKAGYYCDHCRTEYREAVEREQAARKRARTLEAYE